MRDGREGGLWGMVGRVDCEGGREGGLRDGREGGL